MQFCNGCTCAGGIICFFCLQLSLAVFVIILGGLVAWKPKKVIDIQMVIYGWFNWRLEPIDMEKEIRNTRFMGLLALSIGVMAITCVVFHGCGFLKN